MQAQRIAIIGTGISGLTSAYLLSKQHEITVFEANDYVGGHTRTVPVTCASQTNYIDTGFIVCNDRNYPNFIKFMDKLGIKLQTSEMSFSVRDDARNLEYNGHNLNTLFAQRMNLIRPQFINFVRDILRFNKAGKAAIESEAVGEITLDEFVAEQDLGIMFRNNYLLPMVAAIWTCSLKQAGEFPLRFFLKFFLNHGLLDIKNRPQWYVLAGGSQAYIKPMTEPFHDKILLNTPVEKINRKGSSIDITYQGNTERFDQVVVACHSNQALALIEKPTPEERSILGGIQYQDNEVILHSDCSFMPRKPLAWASWNFLVNDGNTSDPPLVTYCMNILQGIKTSSPFLVSLNASHKIAKKKILREFSYAHPVYSMNSMTAQSRRHEICGKDRIHFCGAYWYNGFHEDGVRSALDVCNRFGLSL